LDTLGNGVFDGMKLKVLDLSNNEIVSLIPSMFGESVIEDLLVDGNPLQCNCNLKNILSDGGVNPMKTSGLCTLPKTLLSDNTVRVLNIANLTTKVNCDNDCFTNTSCQNDGQCMLDIDKNTEIYSYQCRCSSGYHGNYCELKKKTSKTLLVIVVIVVIPVLVLIVGLILFRRQCRKKRRHRGDMLPLTDDDFAL